MDRSKEKVSKYVLYQRPRQLGVAPPEFGGSEKGRSLISAYRSQFSYYTSTSGFEKLSTALGGIRKLQFLHIFSAKNMLRRSKKQRVYIIYEWFARAGDDHFLRFAKSWPLIRGARDQTNGNSKELNHFGMIAGLFRPIGSHSSRFALFCSFRRLFTIKMNKSVKVFPFSF